MKEKINLKWNDGTKSGTLKQSYRSIRNSVFSTVLWLCGTMER